jgi:hypothetical protein
MVKTHLLRSILGALAACGLLAAAGCGTTATGEGSAGTCRVGTKIISGYSHAAECEFNGGVWQTNSR